MRLIALCCLLLLTACDDTPSAPAPARSHTAGVVASAAQPAAPSLSSSAHIDEELETVDDTPDSVDEDDTTEDDHPADSCAPKDAKLKPMQLLSFTWASGVEGRDPKDKLHIARPGKRVYAHMRIRNRSGRKRCLHLTFRVGDKKRTEVTLPIGKSWNWRTYAYNTIKSDDRAPLHLVVTDDQGRTMVDQKLAVVPE